MNKLIYEVPIEQIPARRGQGLIVRACEPAALITALADADPECLVGVRLLSLAADSEPLNAWAPGLPVDLVMTDPGAEFPLLYRHTDLLDHHPVRVIVPVQPGFAKAVKVAVSLHFAVCLEPGQPEPVLIEELIEVMAFYLRQPTVAQPVEFFHSTLLGFYHDDPVPLWAVLDADPQCLRYVTDDGAESLPGRLADIEPTVAADADLGAWIEQLLATTEECRSCEFRASCGGYFKWPRHDYACGGVKRLFGLLREAAAELRRDLDSAPV
ncbi:MAG TPA: hypothetical protein P5284_02455 [Candidatus Contendobacter sp.]|nr:hypothetical protein [Candidatus Contendobacter sp.]HRZ24458.1 hypothetical protein [Candidatus Contendobacter sp.]HRZ52016.1 hypothetical protein [Candidatus Contendobacter sp.]